MANQRKLFMRQRGKEGVWYLPYRKLDGGRSEKRIIARTSSEAQRNGNEFLQKLERQRLGLDDGASFDGTVLEAFREYARTASDKGSWNSEEGRWRNHILLLDEAGNARSEFGRKQFRRVTAHDIDVLLQAKLKEGLSPQTVKHLRNHIRRLFTWAIQKAGYLSGKNPGSQSEPIEVPEPTPRAMTDEQLVAILAAAPDEDMRLLLLAAALTGMRKGELLGLRWDAVDEARGVITVSKSYGGKTKTRLTRLVPVPAGLRPFFEWARKHATGPFVFPDTQGGMRTKNFDAAAAFRACLKRAGLVKEWELVCIKRKGGRQGAANHRAKLTQDQAAEVRARIERGERHKDVGARFGISRRAVAFIVTGKTWGKAKTPGGCGYTTRCQEKAMQLCPVCGAPMLARPVPLGLSFKDLRSTFVTRTVEASGDLRGAQLIVGHASQDTTKRHYAVARIEHLQAVVARVPELIFPNRFPTLSDGKSPKPPTTAVVRRKQTPELTTTNE